MDYNSQREKLILAEYGRNIQNMVNQIMTIEDRDERNRGAQAIIDVMGNLFPYLRDIPDFKHKLWDHLAIMSNFQLDIDYPYDPIKPNVLACKPEVVPYNTGDIRYRHYGRIVQMMIKKTAEYPEGAEKDMLIKMIADHMKKCYLTWNKESVDDEKVMEDFRELAKGRIDLPENMQLSDSKNLVQKPKKKMQGNAKQQSNQKRNQGYKSDYRRN
jgi:hypothetical protein